MIEDCLVAQGYPFDDPPAPTFTPEMIAALLPGLIDLDTDGDGTTDALSVGLNLASIPANVTGVKEMTIRASFGKDGLDVADHINLAAPRLIKAPR